MKNRIKQTTIKSLLLSFFIAIVLLSNFSFSYRITRAADETVNKPGIPDETVNKPTIPPKTTAPAPIGKLQNPLRANSVSEVIFLAVDLAVYIGVAFATLAIIFVGFKFVMAQGDPKAISEAKSWFFGIIVGLAILISAKVTVEIIKNTFINAGVVDKNAFNAK